MNKKLLIFLLLSLPTVGARAQRMEALQTVKDCGQVVYSQPVTVAFDLRNKGNKPLFITKVLSSCGCTRVSYPKTAIPAGEAFTVKATYDARTMGHFEKMVEVYGGADRSPLTLTLRGTVVEEVVDFSGDYPYQLGLLKADRDNVEFDDVNRGDRPYQRLHVVNTTSKSVQPQVMHLPGYLSAQVSPSEIAPGHAGVITLSLDSRRLRDFGLTQTSVYLGLFPGDKVSEDNEVPVSVVLLPGFININERTLAYAPQLKLSAEALNLGAFEGKKKKKGEIEITNTGRTPLEIRRLQMFTNGLEVSLSDKTIQPGMKARLKITAVARRLKKTRQRPRVLMITNDPSHPKVIINVNVK